ncbi:MAG: hypothetical protein DRQ02_11555 [Candidatus Latescibacterota bacterium]|nr:MAG: hypothetical protein DRQ02_11555 [Candidatus Latescibacterota bacterium]
MTKSQFFSILYVVSLVAGLELVALIKGLDGQFFATAIGGLTFIAGLILPSPCSKINKRRGDHEKIN